MFYRFIVIVALIWSSIAVARPPASDVQGLYQNTRPDRQEYSPLWGMVALEGELLKGSRFYSDYGILSRDPGKAKAQLHLMAPAVKSFMDRQLKKQQDILAQHPRYSQEQVVDHLEQQLKALKDEKKHLKGQPDSSEKTARLDAIRLEKSKIEDDIEALEEVFYDVPYSAIAAWLQALFPSPQFMILIPNSRNRDPLGDLMAETDLKTLNSVLRNLILYRQGNFSKAIFIEKLTQAFDDFLVRCQKNYKGPDKIVLGQHGYSQNQQEAFRDEFSRLIQVMMHALDEERQNPAIYPDNIVITSLLAFIWERLDSADRLNHLTSIMNGQYRKSTQPWSKETYGHFKTSPQTLVNDPEALAFALSGYDLYDRLVPTLPLYRGGVKASGHKGSPNFHDCGENSLLSFFTIVLNQEGAINIQYLLDAHKDITTSQSLITFWKTKVRSVTDTYTQSVHNDWAGVVSALNQPNDSIPITYVSGGKFEIDGGVYNMLNVIGHLIQDPKLQEAWSGTDEERQKLAAEKFTRLCQIFSRPGFELTWDGYDEQDPKIAEEQDITFLINRNEAFKWKISKSHFEIKSLEQAPNDSWKKQIPVDQLPNIWQQARFMNVIYKPQGVLALYSPNNRTVEGALQFVQANLTTPSIYPVLGRTLTKAIPLDDEGPWGQLVQLMTKNWQNQFFAKYVQDLIPLEDLRKLNGDVLRNILSSLDENGIIAYLAPRQSIITKDFIIRYTAQHGLQQLAEYLRAHNIPLDDDSLNGQTTPLLIAAAANQLSFIQYLEATYNANIFAKDPYNSTALQRAIQGRAKDVFEYLLQRNLSPIMNNKDNAGNTPLHTAINLSGQDPYWAKVLLSRGAALNIKNKDGKYPLQLALEQGKLELIFEMRQQIKAIPGYQNVMGHSLKIDLKRYTPDQVRSFLDHLGLRQTITHLTFKGGNLNEVLQICGMVENLQGLAVPKHKMGIQGLTQIIGLHPHLVSLDASGNSLGDGGMAMIAQGLKSLEELNVVHNIVTSVGAQALSSLPNLTSLNLEQNYIGDAGAQAIATSPQMANLTSLNLGYNEIGAAGNLAIATSPQMANLTSLNLGYNKIGSAGAQPIATSPQMANLTSLNLAGHNIGDAGAQAIATSPQMANLTSLNLEQNYIGAAGARALSRLTNLTSLDLSRNSIGDAGAQAIATSPQMANLTSLSLGGNSIGAAGAQAIATSPQMANLTSLNLRDNNIGAAGAQTIVTSPQMVNLTSLNLQGNYIDDAGNLAIATSPQMANLTSLNLPESYISAAAKSLLHERFGDRVTF